MPKLIPYGENGVTNQLLAAFAYNDAVYADFISRIRWGLNGETGGKATLSKNIRAIVQQMGLGRRKGKGEPDGVIIGNSYVIIIETKMGGPKELVRENKKEILSNYVRLGNDMAKKSWIPPGSYRKNQFLVKNIIEPTEKISNNRWYLLFITDGEWDKDKTQIASIEKELIQKNHHLTENHIGWIGLDSVRAIADKHKLADLVNALKANGKYN